MVDDLPKDSDGNALRQLVMDGSDLSKPMEIDFAIAVPDERSARAVEAAVLSFGFRPLVYHDAVSGRWTCYCAKTMIPNYDDIIAIQAQLDELSNPCGGKSDGWGSFGNA